jgi:hypothetical protein
VKHIKKTAGKNSPSRSTKTPDPRTKDAGSVMTDKLDWTVTIIGYDPIRFAEHLEGHARQTCQPKQLMDDGQRETHFAQYIDDARLRRSFYQALLKIERLPSMIQSSVMEELGLSRLKRKSDVDANNMAKKSLLRESPCGGRSSVLQA